MSSKLTKTFKSLGVATNLFELRGKVKRNPSAYKNDVLRQLNHWDATLKLIKISNTMNKTRQRTKNLSLLIEFLSNVVYKYPNEMSCIKFGNDLIYLLKNNINSLNSIIKKSIILGITILQLNDMINPIDILPLYFDLLNTHDKKFRYIIYTSIVKIIIKINKNTNKNKKRYNYFNINRDIQNYMFNMLKNENDISVKKSLSILIELYKKGIWKNKKMVNIICELCLYHKNNNIIKNSMLFILGNKISMIKDEIELQNMKKNTLKSHAMNMKFNTKRKRKKSIKIAKIEDRLSEKKEQQQETLETMNGNIDLSLIRSIYDPQKFAEKLFGRLKKNKDIWDIKLLQMNLISRVMSSHDLVLYPFYTFMSKYLKPYQMNITQILTYLSQSVHRLVPPNIIKPIINIIANEFIGQFSNNESIAAGLNAIRWICKRQHLVMDKDLLSDLSEYTKYRKDAGVQMASRGLIHLYRIVNPSLLENKHRGKYGSLNMRRMEAQNKQFIFGDEQITVGIPGGDLFEREEELLERIKNGDNTVEITQEEADFIEIDSDFDNTSTDDGEIVVIGNNESNNNTSLIHTRILDDDDLDRIKELRVKNLMQLWGKKSRDQVGLKEDEINYKDIGIDEKEMESITTQKLRDKQRRKDIALNKERNQLSWDEYRKEKGGTKTNKEHQRSKPFKMTQKAKAVIKKSRRSGKLKNILAKEHRLKVKQYKKKKKLRRQ